MSFKQTAKWPQPDNAFLDLVKKAQSVKKDTAKIVNLPPETKLIELLGGTKVDIALTDMEPFVILHFINAKEEKFAFIASIPELAELGSLCVQLIRGLKEDKHHSRPQ